MFNQKQTSLFTTNKKANTSVPKSGDLTNTSNSESKFVNAGMNSNAKQNAQTLSGNGALKYSTTGNDFIDQFASVAQYKAPRSYNDVAADMLKLWNKSPLLAIMFTLYIRLISRVIQYFDGSKSEEVQKGAGLKSEGIMRMVWIHTTSPNSFWKNIALFINVGSWKDVFEMLRLDLEYHGWAGRKLDWNKFGNLLLSGLENSNTRQLILKYLPQIKANSACTTLESQANNLIAKWICSLLFGNKENDAKSYRLYRKLKSSGTAHQWQQLISKKLFDRIDFNSIHGKALHKLVKGKFLKHSGLETRYQEWIGDIANKGGTAKFTGFVAELYQEVTKTSEKHKLQTYDAQYLQLLEMAKVNVIDSPYRSIAVVDVSGSMDSLIVEGNGKVGKLRAADVARSSAIILDDMCTSSLFKGHYLEFNSSCEMFPISGNTFSEKVKSIRQRNVVGSTNFLSVIDLFVKLRNENRNLAENEFPNMVVVLSDGEFNSAPSQGSNIEAARKKLIAGGFSAEYAASFGFCFVNTPNSFYRTDGKTKFETFGDTKNCFYFSGYDLSPLGFLLGMSKVPGGGVPTTASELFDAAMQQEVLLKAII